MLNKQCTIDGESILYAQVTGKTDTFQFMVDDIWKAFERDGYVCPTVMIIAKDEESAKGKVKCLLDNGVLSIVEDRLW